MQDCRCAQECNMCRWDRLNYVGCRCPGCAPQRYYTVAYSDRNKSPIELARTMGILYRRPRECICDARKNVLGELKYQYKEGTP